jgi:RcsF protein
MLLRSLWISLSVVMLVLSGCTRHHQPIKPLPQPLDSESSQNLQLQAQKVHLYKDPTELLSLPFRDMGEVTGEDCQKKKSDKPASLNAARQALQLSAAEMKANAVLIHLCKIKTHLGKCYRQARCQGSALLVNQ